MPEGNGIPERFGRYQVLEELGSGAMGIVYLCVDPALNRPVAVKVLRESELLAPAERERYEERFRREAEAAGGLHHPDIVRVYDVGPSWLVMEFIEGQTLSAFLRSARLTVGQTSELVGRVADAIDYAHHLVRMELPGRVPATADLDVTALRALQMVSLTLPEARPPALTPGQFVDFGLEVVPPRRIAGSPPAYPEVARERGLSGASVVDVWIGANGEVVAVAVAESAGELLDAALLEAVTSWRFTPATLRGVPVSVRLTVRHEFRR